MRRGQTPKWLEENGLIGINLSADYCAEHEWGIREIKTAFGISSDESVFGLERRNITKLPESLFMHEQKRVKYLLFDHWDYLEHKAGKTPHISSELMLFGKKGKGQAEELAAAWSGSDFGIACTGAENCRKLDELFKAFQRLDISIFLGGGGVFENAGLVMAISSLVPKNSRNIMEEADRDVFALHKAAEATGIKAFLENAGKKWHALNPRWKDNSKKEVVFWLNPREQHLHNFGWFSVDQLKLWAENKGPAMKDKPTG